MQRTGYNYSASGRIAKAANIRGDAILLDDNGQAVTLAPLDLRVGGFPRDAVPMFAEAVAALESDPAAWAYNTRHGTLDYGHVNRA